MKRIFYAFALLAFLSSCGEGEPSTIEEKEAKIKELRKEVIELNTKISQYEQEVADAKGINPEDELRQVEVAELKPGTFQHFIEVQGDVSSDKNVQVFPKMAGTIIRRYVEEGQRVRAGQLLATVDVETMRKGIEEIETQLALAKTIYERQANLWKQKIGSEIQYLQAKNNVEALEKSLATQKSQVANGNVTSPISGVVDEFFMNTGEMANPAMPIARVVDLQWVEIGANVSETYTRSIKKGDEVLVSFPAIDMEMPVKIDLVGQTINERNRTFRIEMKAKNKDGFLKPNSAAVVKIKDFEKKDAITIPSNLIQQSTNGERFVYVAEGDNIQKRVIELGKSYKGETLITSGLKAGDHIVVKGYNEVIDGEEVKVAKGDLATNK